MRPSLTWASIWLLAAGCAPSTQQRAARVANTPVTHAAAPRPTTPAAPACALALRRLSAQGVGAARPQVAASGDAFAVAWEETAAHRAVRLQTFDGDARPLGEAIDLAALSEPGAEPRVLADGDGFVVLWTAEAGDRSQILLRHVDRQGRPRSDEVALVSEAGARPLAAVEVGDGLALAWWNWSGTPHVVDVRRFDAHDRPLGKAVAVTQAPSPDPTVDLWPVGQGAVRVAWEEMVEGVQHVQAATLTGERLEGRVDLGAGETPELAGGELVWELPADDGLYAAPATGGAARRIGDGRMPAGATRSDGGATLCYVRDRDNGGEARADELWCGTLRGLALGPAAQVTTAARGILGLQAAAGRERVAVVWQAQENDDSSVSVATVRCGAEAAQARR